MCSYNSSDIITLQLVLSKLLLFDVKFIWMPFVASQGFLKEYYTSIVRKTLASRPGRGDSRVLRPQLLTLPVYRPTLLFFKATDVYFLHIGWVYFVARRSLDYYTPLFSPATTTVEVGAYLLRNTLQTFSRPFV